MAAGDVFVFEEFVLDVGQGKHQLGTHTVKCALLTNTSPPAAADATPTYGDYSANECSGTGYSAGGATVTYTYTEAAGVATLDFSIVTFSQNAAGPENAYYALFYNSSATSKNAIAVMDLGGPLSMRTGDITVDAHASGLTSLTVTNP